MNDLTAALLSAREEGEQLAWGTFVRETAERLDLSDLTFRQTRFARCQFTDCNFSGAAFYGCEFEAQIRWPPLRPGLSPDNQSAIKFFWLLFFQEK